MSPPLRLVLDGDALVTNWRALALQSGDARCGAAVKADGYGLGAIEVVRRISAAGCQNFFVAHWQEALALFGVVPAQQISVLNGFAIEDLQAVQNSGAIPVLNTPKQIAAWKGAGGGLCHVMLDSGINRLGIGPEQISAELFAGLQIDILMSHLACADEDAVQNVAQQRIFAQITSAISHKQRSLANSAGIMLGRDYHYDLTRPGLSIYGGIARSEMAAFIRPVVQIEACVLQIRQHKAGDPIGYNATYRCEQDMPVATIALGYADGYRRSFSSLGMARFEGAELPVLGRVSMDLVTLDSRAVPHLAEGDWVTVDYDLAGAASVSGASQYELLTGLSQRYRRIWR